MTAAAEQAHLVTCATPSRAPFHGLMRPSLHDQHEDPKGDAHT
ncbi:hypothetical protein SAMN05444149_10227 [Pseudosulfitobacter pseudonitzschiae]|nr:hypothetical protein SAMN05444149_10227 [Pseudosulfitobacter pseudonitzschiae]